uniref:RanBP2-type domain-containing protein n=1 Tax=viral metagenome TaxID=1070528 RepID=A0A6C0J4C9_9ZZZZ
MEELYKKKYLKYKKKYLNLINQIGGTVCPICTFKNKLSDITCVMCGASLIKQNPFGSTVMTRHNNGGEKDYTNSCMWISILDYIRHIRGNKSVTLKVLRQLANSDLPEDKNAEFDNKNKRYTDGLLNICLVYNIQLRIYSRDSGGKLILSDVYPPPGSSLALQNPDIVNIMSFGRHFELITTGETPVDESQESGRGGTADGKTLDTIKTDTPLLIRYQDGYLDITKLLKHIDSLKFILKGSLSPTDREKVQTDLVIQNSLLEEAYKIIDHNMEEQESARKMRHLVQKEKSHIETLIKDYTSTIEALRAYPDSDNEISRLDKEISILVKEIKKYQSYLSLLE